MFPGPWKRQVLPLVAPAARHASSPGRFAPRCARLTPPGATGSPAPAATLRVSAAVYEGMRRMMARPGRGVSGTGLKRPSS